LVFLGLFCLLVGTSRAFAQAGGSGNPSPRSLEDLIHQQAIQKVQAALGGTFVPPQSAPAAAAKAKAKTIVPFARKNTAHAAVDAPGFKCLPTCDVTDGRFLAIAGSGLLTLSPPELELAISVPAGSTSFDLGVFDGDGGEYQSDGFTAFWDSGDTASFEYTLYADPQANGTGTTLIELQPGFPAFPSSSMPDNDWIDFTVNTGPEAAAPSGNFFYLLKIRLLDPSVVTLNAFKVRSNAVISGLTLNPVARPFSYIATWTALTDISVVYPAFPLPTPTTYDGTFRFFIDVPVTQSQVFLWDGDFDHGDFLLTNPDTDDPDTPSAPLPPWSTSEVRPEGVAVGAFGSTGDPADDNDIAGFGIYMVRPPAVRYDLVFPDGQSFANDNPSGNQEWEQFKVSTAPFDRSQMDYHTDSIPPGTYQLSINGVDMLNLNALLLPYRVLCVDEQGVPCKILRPYLVGDTVFADTDGDGNQEPGENGIPGVVLELRDPSNALIGTTTTDATGHYQFETESGSYTVDVAASNFSAGGALVGYVSTTGDSRTDTVTTDNVLTYDFGYRGTGSVGDRVWLDTNANGAQDTGETGLNGVTVQLLNGSGNVIATTTTSGNGNYTFTHLAPGTYTVSVDETTLPAGLVPSSDLDGIGTPNDATFPLAASANRTDVDFGYKGTASIGDRVWYDLNGNGVQDGNETGLNGVTVKLLDSSNNVLATKTTSGSGNYSFNELPAGTYKVTVDLATLPAGTVQTFDADGVATANTTSVTLAAGTARTEIDFGYRGTSSLGDRVWSDANANGAQDTGETGINGVTVQLYDSAGNLLATKTTSGDGNYSFTNLLAGQYRVQIVAGTLPAGLAPSFDIDGTATMHTATVQVAAATNRTDVDFGYRGTTSLGDRVWYDNDADGVQDTGETGINGVTVQLLNSGGTVVATTTTSGDGNYSFNDLVAGTYTVRIVAASLPAGVVQTYDLDGTASNHQATVTLTAGVSRSDVDFGYRGTASIGDRLWYDTDADGVQDSGEPGLPGTTVELLNSAGTVIATTTAGADGIYKFSNLAAGSYTVRVVASTLPVGGVAPTYDLDGTGTPNTAAVTLAGGASRTDVDFGYRGTRTLGDRVWNDVDGDGVQDSGEPGINGVTVHLFLGTTEVASAVTAGDGKYTFTNLPDTTFIVKIDTATLPAGMVPTYDLDGTGTPNQATVTLTGSSRTDVDFGYRTPPATCTPGYVQDKFTTASFSNNDGSLSWSGDWIEYDVAGTGVSTGNVTVGTPVSGYLILRDAPDTGTQPSAARQVNLSSFTSATLSFDYHTRDGVDPDDAAVVEISKDGGATYTVLETFTGITGTVISSRTYDISAYRASNTRIRFRISANYGGDDELFKIDQVRIDGACSTQTGSIGNRVWQDSDGGADQDAGETGLNGVTVQLLSSGGTVLATQTTSGDGNYLFSGLAAGTYKVQVVSSTLPSGYTQTYDLDGTGTANIATFTLATGQSRTDVDFGYRPPATCTAGYFLDTFTTAGFSNNEGSLSWTGAWVENDTAGTGASSGNVTVGTPVSGYMILRDSPDTGTQPSAARQVNLTGFSSATLTVDFHIRGVETSDAAVIEVSKDGGASYTVLETFTGITGTYISSRTYDISAYRGSNTRIRFRISANYEGSDDFFKIDQVRIDAGCSTQTGSIGDRVWKDSDGGADQDSGETGLNGVTVQLLSSSGTVLATQTTSGDGNYLFSGLAAGTYTVKVVSSTLPSGYTQTYDLDGTGSAHTAAVTLAAGQNRTDADFGYRPPASCTAGYFQDQFNSDSFSNNNGTLTWAGAWVEYDTAGAGVGSGNVTVGTPYSGYLILRDAPDTGTQPSAARQANLSGFTSATLSFDFHTKNVETDDAAVIEVSKDGGATYTVLQTLTGFTGDVISSRSFNISSYISSNTRIRFRVSANYGASDDLFKVDQVRIDAACQ
jgi:hypothetical protein